MVRGEKETGGGRIVRVDKRKLSEKLQREGFLEAYVWQDAPGTLCPEHTHAPETAPIIPSGERTYRALGKNGPPGCRHWIGER